MERTQADASTSKPIHWSIRTILIGAVFVVMLAGAAVIDVDAVIQYFTATSGSPPMILEYGSIITGLAAAPFLAMGLSIGEDELHPKA
jgi:hypothetical protein